MGDRPYLRRTSGKSDKVKGSKLSLNGLSPAGILISLSAAVGVLIVAGTGIIALFLKGYGIKDPV